MSISRPEWHDPRIISVPAGHSPVITGVVERDTREAPGLLLRVSGTTLCLLFTGLPIMTSLPDATRKPPASLPVTCTQVEELALRHFTGMTDTRPSRRVVRHLDQCPRCQQYWQRLNVMTRPQRHVRRDPTSLTRQLMTSSTPADHGLAMPAKLSL